MKGVFLRTNILCDTIPPPPPGANAKPPELGPDMTTRESVEALTEMPGTICAGCHQTGDQPARLRDRGLRRARAASARRSACSTPPAPRPGRKPVNTIVASRRSSTAITTAISTPAELMSLMLASGKVEACLSRNFFRFTYGRWETPAADGCALEDARKALAGGGNITDLVAADGEGGRSSSGARSSRGTTMARQVIDISRRQMLRGIGGATLALPILPSLLCRTAYGADPVFTRPPRLYWVTTDHGGAFEASMFPSTSLLTASQALYSDHTVRSGALVPTTSGSDTVLSPVLRAPSSSLSAALVAKMNVLWGLDVPFYIAHNTGLHLGNYARNDGNGGDGKAVQAFPRPTIDQIMAWSPSFYSNLSGIRERAMIMSGRPVSWNYSDPAMTVQHDPERARLFELAGAVQQDLRAATRRAGAARADRRPRAGQLQPPAPRATGGCRRRTSSASTITSRASPSCSAS